MTNRATFTLDDEAHTFLIETGGKNKSAYINQLSKKERQRVFEDAILKANKEEAADPDYQEEISAWDETLSDGLNL